MQVMTVAATLTVLSDLWSSDFGLFRVYGMNAITIGAHALITIGWVGWMVNVIRILRRQP